MSQRKLDEIINSLEYHAGDGNGKKEKFEALRSAAIDFAKEIEFCTPESREQSLAFTHLEETLMWAIKSVAIRD